MNLFLVIILLFAGVNDIYSTQESSDWWDKDEEEDGFDNVARIL